MTNKKKTFLIVFLIVWLFGFGLVNFCLAESASSTANSSINSTANSTKTAPGDEFFIAKVVEVIAEQTTTLPDGKKARQQKLRLLGLSGQFKGKEVIFNGIGDFDVINKKIYQKGDKVLAVASYDDQGQVHYYVTDYVRTSGLGWLAIVFILAVLVVGRWKGLRSLVALAATFFVLIKFIIPRILTGANPLLITLVGSAAVLLLIVYITEGFNARSHIAVLSIFLSLVITVALSSFFVGLTKLSGLASEETSFLVSLLGQTINFQGLLLAGIIIGTLGVLDDVVISQVAAVEEILKANKYQSRKEVFQSAYRVGVSHISSMTNTLFLAYAGASLPLLILFVSGQSAFRGWGQVINNEAIATEIVRTLAGSIGLILSVPIATLVAVWWFKRG
jgi:uncharacterized membrane protein